MTALVANKAPFIKEIQLAPAAAPQPDNRILQILQMTRDMQPERANVKVVAQ